MPSQRQSLACAEDDMKEKLAKSPRLKLALAIAVPVLVMVVTVVMIGASFAWFTDSPDVYIDTISFSTAEAFSLTFEASNGDNLLYGGQTAVSKISPDRNTGGYLITPTWALANDKSVDDKPYCFASRINISSNGKTADINLMLDGADIYKSVGGEGEEQRVNENTYSNQIENLPYAFTWFFREAKTDASGNVIDALPKNYTQTETADKTIKTMMDYNPKSGDVWYTPYGKLEFNDSSIVTKINDQTTDLTMSKRDIVNFNTGEGAKAYDFFIVFAPEEMFFREFFSGMGGKKAIEVYGENTVAINHIYSRDDDGIYYSHLHYMGAEFAFSALLNVVRLDETAGA